MGVASGVALAEEALPDAALDGGFVDAFFWGAALKA